VTTGQGTAAGAKSYGQFCGVARALDLVGDRWTLLIVRELLVRPARYAELRANLPGIATNLLAQRLRELQARGIVERDAEAGWGSPYRLTELGVGLEGVLGSLVRWSTPLMTRGRGRDEFRASWLVVALRGLLVPAPGFRSTVQLVVEGEPLVVDGRGADLEVTLGTTEAPHVTLEGPAELILGLASGAVPVPVALRHPDVRVAGALTVLRALVEGRPAPA
jgi:DNA-binding HxlR family transcriptional regulator